MRSRPRLPDAPAERRPGAPVPLDGGDLAFLSWLGTDRDPLLHIALAARLPGPVPSAPQLRRLAAGTAARAPVLTYRLTGAGRHARWEPDLAFDPAHHVAHRRVPPGTDVRQAVIDAVRELPLHPRRPLWTLMVIHGHRDDEHVLCYRVHHGFQDGVGAARTINAVLLGKPLSTPVSRAPAKPAAGRWLRLMTTGARLAGRSARLRPPATTADGGTRLRVHHCDAAPLTAIAAETGASITQVALAVLTGALRSWNPRHWERGRPARRGLTISFPLNLSGRLHDGGLGNGCISVPVVLPCGEPCPRGRLRRVMAETGFERLSRYRHDRYLLRSPLLAWGAGAVIGSRAMERLLLRGAAGGLVVSAIAAGDSLPVDRCFAVPPTLDFGGGVIVIVHGGGSVVFSGLWSRSLGGTERLAGLLDAAVAELAAAVGVGGSPGSPVGGAAVRR
ncbi:wax ester/triacylglycerol synthase domain-containing protein [Nonomuraea sp. NPDC003214]